MPAVKAPCEGSFPGLQTAAFPLCPPMGGKKGEQSFLVSLLIRSLILEVQSPAFMTSFSLVTSGNALSPNVATLGVEASIYMNVGGGGDAQFSPDQALGKACWSPSQPFACYGN